jgi:soluble lytic murein transglycosylase
MISRLTDKDSFKNIICSDRFKVFLSFMVFLLPVVILIAGSASAYVSEGKEYLKKGSQALEEGRYEDAVKDLSLAQREFPLLGDYALSYLSEAYRKLGEHKKSLEAVRMLLEKYSRSPLVKKARVAEIREAKENSQEDLKRLYETYVRDFPDDEEIMTAYGLFLKKAGDTARAKDLLKKIYIGAGTFSKSAYTELESGDITVGDLIERASNLIKKYEYREAEHDLKKALSMDNGKNRDEILETLAYSLFRQKEYKESAALYEKIHDLYLEARSLYRAGEKEEFEKVLNDLLAANDPRAGDLLVTVAADRRRDKCFEEALKIYTYVLEEFPAEAEEASWGIGWTHYMAGNYKKSADFFSKLYSKYGDPKYLYWQARSIEAQGEGAKDLYQPLAVLENTFYGVAANARGIKVKTDRAASSGDHVPHITSEDRHRFDRFDALLSLGMNREAITELIFVSKKLDSPSGLLYVISRFQELGEFRRSIRLAMISPYSEKLHSYWYPLAYWDNVEKISKKYDIDPFVVLAVMREESRFDSDARSVAGAIGLMQIMPETAYRLDKNLKLGINRESQISDATNNITLGAYHLKSLLSEFKSLPHAIAAYNAGRSIVKKWQLQGNYKSADEFIEDIPYAETRNYVKKGLTSFFQYKRASASDAGSEINLGGL